jgi:hypothetical protein
MLKTGSSFHRITKKVASAQLSRRPQAFRLSFLAIGDTTVFDSPVPTRFISLPWLISSPPARFLSFPLGMDVARERHEDVGILGNPKEKVWQRRTLLRIPKEGPDAASTVGEGALVLAAAAAVSRLATGARDESCERRRRTRNGLLGWLCR